MPLQNSVMQKFNLSQVEQVFYASDEQQGTGVTKGSPGPETQIYSKTFSPDDLRNRFGTVRSFSFNYTVNAPFEICVFRVYLNDVQLGGDESLAADDLTAFTSFIPIYNNNIDNTVKITAQYQAGSGSETVTYKDIQFTARVVI